MRVLILEPWEEPKPKDIDGSLESMQEIVGGLIQVIYPFEDETIALVCNDEGKLLGLPPNRGLRDENGDIYDIIAGTFFLCSAKPENENFSGLSDEELTRYTEKYKNIEIYLWR